MRCCIITIMIIIVTITIATFFFSFELVYMRLGWSVDLHALTSACQKAEPPRAASRYMLMMKSCTSVTSMLRDKTPVLAREPISETTQSDCAVVRGTLRMNPSQSRSEDGWADNRKC